MNHGRPRIVRGGLGSFVIAALGCNVRAVL